VCGGHGEITQEHLLVPPPTGLGSRVVTLRWVKRMKSGRKEEEEEEEEEKKKKKKKKKKRRSWRSSRTTAAPTRVTVVGEEEVEV
jgi:hypothetical protein